MIILTERYLSHIILVTKKKIPNESSNLAQRIGDGRDILRRILAEPVHSKKFKVMSL